MHYWIRTLFLVAILSFSLEATLYRSLKALPVSPYVLAPQQLMGETLQSPFSDAFYDHEMRGLLDQGYPLLDPFYEADYVIRDINVNEQLSAEMRALTEDTLYTQFALIAGVGVLVLMPQSISNWDLEELQQKSLGTRWKEHVTTKPVWDQDDWGINYVGHPISGAVYYTMARNDGMDIFESALYSTIMSSLFWEYGYEAFAEIPSIQDLIVTPLFGSFLGEGMHVLEQRLDANGGEIWGSKGLGSFSYFWLDPMGSMAGGLSDFFDLDVTMEFATFSRYDDPSIFRLGNDQAQPVRFQERDYGVMLTFY